MSQEFVNEVKRLAFAIERTVASDPSNIWCREARVMAHELVKLAAQQSVKPDFAMCSDLIHSVRKAEGDDFCKTCGRPLSR